MLVLAATVWGQGAYTQVLGNYIKQGIETNEPLKQQQFQLEKSIYALKEAQGLFLPSVNLLGNYYLAKGGRTISLPLNDLLGKVYSTLNQLTNTSGFPSIQNQEIQFNPNNFYDVKLRTSVPIVDAEIYYNSKIKKELVGVQQAEVNVYKRELVKDIKTAYFKYLQATEAVSIYGNALSLVKESRRVNQSLVNNGAANQTVLMRSSSEVSRIEAQQAEAKANMKNAAAYFNFLINKPLESPIEIDSSYYGDAAFYSPQDSTVENREERRKINAALQTTNIVGKLNKAYNIPKLSAFLDLGSQEFDFKFNNQSKYYMFGLALDWPIFSGFTNTNKARQTSLDIATLKSQAEDIDNKLQLQVRMALNAYYSSIDIYRSAGSQASSAERYNSDTQKRYKEGQALYIETLDARTEYINALVQHSIARFNVWVKLSELERANGSYQL